MNILVWTCRRCECWLYIQRK